MATRVSVREQRQPAAFAELSTNNCFTERSVAGIERAVPSIRQNSTIADGYSQSERPVKRSCHWRGVMSASCHSAQLGSRSIASQISCRRSLSGERVFRPTAQISQRREWCPSRLAQVDALITRPISKMTAPVGTAFLSDAVTRRVRDGGWGLLKAMLILPGRRSDRELKRDLASMFASAVFAR